MNRHLLLFWYSLSAHKDLRHRTAFHTVSHNRTPICKEKLERIIMSLYDDCSVGWDGIYNNIINSLEIYKIYYKEFICAI